MRIRLLMESFSTGDIIGERHPPISTGEDVHFCLDAKTNQKDHGCEENA